MTIMRDVVLRYRAQGHIRFQIPRALCEPQAASALIGGLRAQEGIYRVDISPVQGKLSIRFMDTVCGFQDVIQGLRRILTKLSLPARTAPSRGLPSRRNVHVPTPMPAGPYDRIRTWLAEKWLEARETTQAMSILIGRSARSAMTAANRRPRWVKEFMNDLLMLYLIKLHWHHIVAEWLPRPWTYRYEWLATVYLIYLSVQARLPPNA